MVTPFATRVRLKIKRIARELTESPAEREFRRDWSLIDSLEGWLSGNEGLWLFAAARSLPQGANLVEVGSFKGRSTCCLALGCRGTDKRVFAVDRFDGGPDLPKLDSFPDFARNLEARGLSQYVTPIVGSSQEVAKTWDKPIHFLFIDGSHNFEDVVADFEGFFPHLIPGSMVAFHDVHETWPGVLRAWREVIQDRLERTGYCECLAYGRKP